MNYDINRTITDSIELIWNEIMVFPRRIVSPLSNPPTYEKTAQIAAEIYLELINIKFNLILILN